MMIVFSGLPGTGKTTVARAVAARLGGALLRVDVIEQAILRSLHGYPEVGAAGYAVAHAIADSNLALGRWVIADCVNPVQESRAAWRAVARRASVRMLDVGMICSDRQEHRRRVEHRLADIPGHVLPSWESILHHAYEPWTEPRLIVDTASSSVDEAAEMVVRSAV